MQNDIPDWLKDIAQKVHDLTRQPRALDRFHVMMKQWKANLDEQRAKQKEWEAKRQRHFEKLAELSDNDPKRTQSDKPQTRGWVWEHGRISSIPDALISGWVPPALSRGAEPKVDRILQVFDRGDEANERPLRLDEKYTLLAVVHDSVLMGVEKINPWPWNQNDIEAMKEAMPYAVLLYGELAGELPEVILAAERELRTFLADVEADLKANATDQAEAEETTRDMNKPKDHLANFKTWVYAHKILVAIVVIVMVLIPLFELLKDILDVRSLLWP